MSRIKIYLSQINPTVGDISGNCAKILAEHKLASEAGCDLIVFSEMTLSGYPCEDLWQKKHFVRAAEEKVFEICKETRSSKCAILLGSPTTSLAKNKKEVTHNSAILIEQGEVKKIINKKTLPNYGVYDEARYFTPANALSFIEFRGLTLAILICEDLWDLKNIYLLQEQIFDGIIALNASPYSNGKHEVRQKIAASFCKNSGKPLFYVNQVGGQDSLVFDGASFLMNKEGEVVLQMKEFVEDFAIVEIDSVAELQPFAEPVEACLDSELQHASTSSANGVWSANGRNYSACVLGLHDYISKNNFQKVLLGMSGGIDSALVATMAVDALGAENVALYALPTRFNPESSMIDAKTCAKNLGVNLEIIAIESIFESMLFALKQSKNETSALAVENLQSRIRGNILMTISNSSGALLLSTGNKSELSCGYATLYGDMCGAFNPLKDLYKTQVYELAKWRNEKSAVIPQNILTKAPSAELRENQKDSDSLPDYDILDKILFSLIEEQKSISETAKNFDETLVKKVAKLISQSEYKRRQAVIGPKISNMSFDKDRRYPITNKFTS